MPGVAGAGAGTIKSEVFKAFPGSVDARAATVPPRVPAVAADNQRQTKSIDTTSQI